MTVRRAGIALTVIAILAFIVSQRSRFTPLDVGSAAPDYGAPSLAGDTLELKDLRGRVVVLNFWATWCAPCLEEMPSLQRLYDRLSPRGLEVVAVGLDDRSDIREFANRLGLTFTILHDAPATIEHAFGVTGLPATFVIDRNGRIQRKDLGPRAWDDPELASEIQALLEE